MFFAALIQAYLVAVLVRPMLWVVERSLQVLVWVAPFVGRVVGVEDTLERVLDVVARLRQPPQRVSDSSSTSSSSGPLIPPWLFNVHQHENDRRHSI